MFPFNEINEKFKANQIDYQAIALNKINQEYAKNHQENTFPLLSIFKGNLTIIEAFEQMTTFFSDLDEKNLHFS